MSRVSWSITLTVIFLFSGPLLAQTTSTRLDGTVVDPSGNAIQKATVTVTDEGTSWTAQTSTDAQGRYVFPALGATAYTVSVKADGYKTLVRYGVSMIRPGSVTEGFVLQPGAPTETDEEDQMSDPLPQTDSESSGAFSRRELDGLPLVARDPLLLLAYQPGIQIAGGKEGTSTVNGARQNANLIGMDGVSVTNPVNPLLGSSLIATNPDAIKEVRIVTDGAPAEYGQTSGAQVMLISRSGTNAWHGNAFDYYRPDSLNAHDFFANSLSFVDVTGGPLNPAKPTFRQNIYGATISGPVWKNKTFVLGNYQGHTTDQQQLVNSLVLTPSAKTGIFQWHTPGTTDLQSFDIAGNDPRKIGIDPTVKSILAKLPDPNNNTIGDSLNTSGFLFNSAADSRDNQFTGRIDQALTDTHRLFARFSWNRSRTTDAPAQFPGEQAGTQVGRNWGVVAGSDWTINSRMVNELRAGHLNSSIALNRPDRAASAMFVFNTWTPTASPAFPRNADYPITEASDNLSFILGNHTFKTGVMFRRTQLNSTDLSGIYPDMTFGLNYGNEPPASVGPSVTSAISLRDRLTFESLYNDLLGRVEKVSQTFNANSQVYLPVGSARIRSYAYQNYAVFLQDDWKVRQNLALSLGIRYELSSVPHEANGLQAALDQASQVSPTANISGFSFIPGGAWYKRDTANFAPRVGFAWDLSKKGTMVLRGSYGLFYNQLAGDVMNFVDQNTPAFSQLTTVYPNTSGSDVRLSDKFALPVAPAAPILKPPLTRLNSVGLFDPSLHTGRVQQFNVTLQREIFGNVLEAGYAGSRANNLLMYVDLNQTKIEGNFLQAFNQLQSFRASGTPVPASNSIVKVFGSPRAAINAIGGSNIDLGLVGVAAEIMDRSFFSQYAAAGVSDFYLRNFPQFNQFILGTNSGKAWYDSVHLGIRRSRESYSVSANYTLSKTLDNISMASSTFVAPSDSFNPGTNKAPSDFDRPRVFNAYATWLLPLREQGLFSGWNLGLMGIWENGQRFTVSSGRETAQSGVASLANYSGSRYIGLVLHESNAIFWLTQDEVNQFTFPTAGARGTSGRNPFIGPGYFSIDASLHKSFRLTEGKSVMFRVDCLNFLNHPNFGLPGTNLSDPATFGRITTQVGSPRALQLALRFQF